MLLNLAFVKSNSDTHVTVTGRQSESEIQRELAASGSKDQVVAVMSFDGDSDVINLFRSLCSIAGVQEQFRSLLEEVFELGKDYGEKWGREQDSLAE